MVSRKLNSGPANTVAARFQIGWVWKATLRSASESDGHFGIVRLADGIHVADELDVAAERDRAQLPARAAPVVEADQFRAEADRERLDADAAPAADQIVAHLVDEDDDRQHEQERHDGADQQAVRAEYRRQACRSRKILRMAPDSAARSVSPQCRQIRDWSDSGSSAATPSQPPTRSRSWIVGAAEQHADHV